MIWIRYSILLHMANEPSILTICFTFGRITYLMSSKTMYALRQPKKVRILSKAEFLSLCLTSKHITWNMRFLSIN